MNRELLYQESKQLIDTFLAGTFPPLDLDSLDNETTLVCVVDMINGFAKEGALYSDRVERLIDNQVSFLKQLKHARVQFVSDAHPIQAGEFKVFPSHCLEGTMESEVVKALQPFVTNEVIKKNSTNAYLEAPLQALLQKHHYQKIVFIGCCTDLCIMQLAMTIKTHYNRLNEEVTLYVPMHLVDTFDLAATNHPGDFMHLMALKMMQDNGIQIMK